MGELELMLGKYLINIALWSLYNECEAIAYICDI